MKTPLRLIIVFIAGFGVVCIGSLVSLFLPRHGEAARVSDLKKAFSTAGPAIEATFTNSILQKFPFDGPITWRLIFLKDPFLSLNARVNTNELRTFISANPGMELFWSGKDNKGQEWTAGEWPTADEYPSVVWQRLYFRTPHTNEFSGVIDGDFDIISNRVHFAIY